MIDARLLLPAATAWLAAVVVIVGAAFVGDPVERHGHAIAIAGSVHVVVRFDTPGAIELPDDVVNKFESYEGHPLVGMP